MIRSFHLADLFTLANAFCGMGAVFVSMLAVETGDPRRVLLACAFIPLSFIFDALDGRIARWRRKHSAMGRELDSLADVIAFGVAPATVAYAAGLRGFWDCLVLTYFVGCGVSRLARFNVTAEAMTGDGGKVSHFEGTPIPTSLVLVVIIAIAAWQGRVAASVYWGEVTVFGATLHPLVLLFALSGSLMISTIRIPKL